MYEVLELIKESLMLTNQDDIVNSLDNVSQYILDRKASIDDRSTFRLMTIDDILQDLSKTKIDILLLEKDDIGETKEIIKDFYHQFNVKTNKHNIL